MEKFSQFKLILIFGFFLGMLLTGCGGEKVGGTIVGKVNDTFHGGGVGGARVILTSDGLELATATTDSSGNFTFSGLPPGFYTIVLTKDGFYDNKVEAKVEEGKETKVDTWMIVAFGGT